MFGFFKRPVRTLTHTALLKGGVPLFVIDSCAIHRKTCDIDGKVYRLKMGAWAFYVPELQMKLLHAVDGRVHCTHDSAPPRDRVFSGSSFTTKEPYQERDWFNIYSKSVLKRAAENYVMYKRLHENHIGPEPLGCCLVRSIRAAYTPNETFTVGVMLADLTRYPRKRRTTEAQMIAAGVTPDKIRSALRQQIRGYVSDLNSVVGAMPIAGEQDVSLLEQELSAHLHSR